MEKENQPETVNVQVKKDFKLRSSLKRSVRNISEVKDDSMECPDETVGGLRRRVSFAASSTVKPFVNDPVQMTIWDNTYEEKVDHTDSINTLSTASVVSSKEINIVMSCQEPDEALKNPIDPSQKKKCLMSKTITEIVDMNYTCQFDKAQQKVNLHVTDTKKSVNESNMNWTMYPDEGMSFTCVFPDKQDANVDTSVYLKEKSVNTDMEFTCISPAQKEVNSECDVKEQTRFLGEDLSMTCIFPATKELNVHHSGDGITRHSIEDMDFTCGFQANKEMNVDNSVDGNIHRSADMSLTCVFPASTVVQPENHANQPINNRKNMSLSCVGSRDLTTHDDSIEKMSSIVTNEKLIANESNLSVLEEGFSFKSDNLQRDALRDSKATSPLLYVSDGLGSIQKPSFLSNTSIDNTHQLLQSRLFHVSDISSLKPMNKSEDPITMNKCLESSAGSNNYANRILNNIELKIYHPSRSTAITMQKCKDTLKYSKSVCDKYKAYLREFVETKHHVSKLGENVKRLSSLYASSASSVSLSNECDEDLQDAEMDNDSVIVSKHKQIMDVFLNTDPTSLKLISFQDNDYTFSTYFSAVRVAVSTHPEDGRVLEVKVKSQLNPNPQKSILFMQNAFLVKHIMNKLQMSNLMLSLGRSFDMLSLLHHIEIIIEKCIDFVYDFTIAQREFKTLKMLSDGVVQFNILHTNPPIFWTVEFQMSSPDTILQESLRVSSKWSSINTENFASMLLNVQPGTDCIKQFANGVFDFFQKNELRKLKYNN